MELSEADLQGDLDRRKPGTSRHTTQRREADDTVEFLRSQAHQQLWLIKVEDETRLWLRRLRDEAYVEYIQPG